LVEQNEIWVEEQRGAELIYRTLGSVLKDFEDPLVVLDHELGSVVITERGDPLENGPEYWVNKDQLDKAGLNYMFLTDWLLIYDEDT
jgi:hypothetical protein